jgi:broad specificity phosphatase PhoE
LLHIYLTRHGETEWNIQHRLQGWKDSPLTSKGINDAMALRQKISDIRFQSIYSSPSTRALNTAKILSGDKKIPIIQYENLREINFGEWEGKTKSEINERFENEFSSLWESPNSYDHQPHNGESISNVRKRVEDVLKSIIETNKHGNVLIVTHAVIVATMIAYFKNAPTEKLWDIPFVHGTSLSHIEIDVDNEHVNFKLLCDMDHLHDNF